MLASQARSFWCQAGGLSQKPRAPMSMVSGALASLGFRVEDLRFKGLGFIGFRVSLGFRV